MKRTPISVCLADFPAPFHPFLENATVYDSSCSPEARVFFIERDEGYYLKHAPTGTLELEMQQTRYFHTLGLGARVLAYHREQGDWLLCTRVPGEDATHPCYLAEPERLATCIATHLRALHERAFQGCPVQNHTERYLQTVEKNHALGLFEASFLPPHLQKMTAKEAFRFLQEGKHLLETNTLLHGDYCLPNIMLQDWRLCGFIDLGNGGVGDRHVDIFWGAWTLGYNCGKGQAERLRALFFDTYGRDGIDFSRLDLIAAAECFG